MKQSFSKAADFLYRDLSVVEDLIGKGVLQGTDWRRTRGWHDEKWSAEI